MREHNTTTYVKRDKRRFLFVDCLQKDQDAQGGYIQIPVRKAELLSLWANGQKISDLILFRSQQEISILDALTGIRLIRGYDIGLMMEEVVKETLQYGQEKYFHAQEEHILQYGTSPAYIHMDDVIDEG